jgi:GTP-binding protein
VSAPSFRNVALVAHVDHGKTTLVDAILNTTGVFGAHEARVERVLDSNDQERERGITILAKAVSVEWRGVRINLVDTPGHADFGGEVERALALVDGILLLVDAADGPMPQTRYVLSKALALNLPAVVVLNKVDRPDARGDAVIDDVYQLFMDLGAADHHIEFPIVSTDARAGRALAGVGVPGDDADLAPLLDAILETIPPPHGNPAAPLQALVTNLDASDYLGRLALGRVAQGTLRAGQQVALCHANEEEPPIRRRLTQLLGFSGLGRIEVTERFAGDLFVVAGFPEVEIGDTLADPVDPQPLPRLQVDEPVLRMTFGVNTSPLSGRDGTRLTSRQIRERLDREVRGNVSIRIGPTTSPEIIEVSGRGELQLAVLIETMRREGFELQVSRPEVIIRQIGGVPHEPVERAVIDVPNGHVGTVTQAMAPRKGQVTDLRPGDAGRTVLTVVAPARGLLGLRSLLMTATRGTALVHQHHDGWQPWAGDLPGRSGGAMVADRSGVATGFALENLQRRGEMFVGIGGESSRPDEMVVNPTRAKELTNIRTHDHDDAVRLSPPHRPTLETGIEWIAEDELVEVTPQAIRLRKRYLTESERRHSRKTR